MSFYSKQEWYCSVCGKREDRKLAGAGFHNLACSVECWREHEWRKTLSIMGKDYYADPRKHDES